MQTMAKGKYSGNPAPAIIKAIVTIAIPPNILKILMFFLFLKSILVYEDSKRAEVPQPLHVQAHDDVSEKRGCNNKTNRC